MVMAQLRRGGYQIRHVSDRNIYRVGNRFRVRLRWKGSLINVGRFATIAEAKKARDEWMLAHLGANWRDIQASRERYRSNLLGRAYGESGHKPERKTQDSTGRLLVGMREKPFSLS